MSKLSDETIKEAFTKSYGNDEISKSDIAFAHEIEELTLKENNNWRGLYQTLGEDYEKLRAHAKELNTKYLDALHGKSVLLSQEAQSEGIIYQWRSRRSDYWLDASKEIAYERVDEHYEARTLYTAPQPKENAASAVSAGWRQYGLSRAEFHDKAWALYHAKTFSDTMLAKVNIHTIRTVFDAVYDAAAPTIPISAVPVGECQFSDDEILNAAWSTGLMNNFRFSGFPQLIIDTIRFMCAQRVRKEAAPTLPAGKSEWQPIETAPKEGLICIWITDKPVLGRSWGQSEMWAYCYYDAICDEWRTTRPSGHLRMVPARYVTHWMPIEAPSKSEES